MVATCQFCGIFQHQTTNVCMSYHFHNYDEICATAHLVHCYAQYVIFLYTMNVTQTRQTMGHTYTSSMYLFIMVPQVHSPVVNNQHIKRLVSSGSAQPFLDFIFLYPRTSPHAPIFPNYRTVIHLHGSLRGAGPQYTESASPLRPPGIVSRCLFLPSSRSPSLLGFVAGAQRAQASPLASPLPPPSASSGTLDQNNIWHSSFVSRPRQKFCIYQTNHHSC